MTLRVVTAGEQAPRKRRKSVTAAAKGGNQRELLVALRDRVAETVQDPNCPPRDLAALSRRLQDIAKEIAVLDSLEVEDDIGRAASTPDEGWGEAF